MNKNISKYILFAIENLRHEYLYTYLKELEFNEKLTRKEVLNLQKEKLRLLLSYVIDNNSFYQKKFKGYDLDDIECLPILKKDQLRESYRSILSSCSSKLQKLDLVETSGSTGMPLQFYRDRVTFGYNLASQYRAHHWWGLDVGCKEAMLWGIPVSLKGRLKVRIKDFALNRFREKQYNINNVILNDFYKKVIRKKPDYIFGYTSMVYEFALFLSANNISLHDTSIKCAICTAEKIYPYQKRLIEQTFGCRLISEYGATETGIIAYDCPEGCNHVSDDTVYLEVVDKNNKLVGPGRSGKVLVTVLHSFASPIIRYDLGDITSFSKDMCKCGLPFSVIGDIEGRISDVVISPDGNVYHSIIFYYIFKELIDSLVGGNQYKIIQKKVDHLDIYIIKNVRYTDSVELFIKKEILDKFGDKMKFNVYYVDSIDRSSSGKLKDFETDLDTKLFLNKIYGQTI